MKKYRLELDVNKHPVLVMEEEYEYKDIIINSGFVK